MCIVYLTVPGSLNSAFFPRRGRGGGRGQNVRLYELLGGQVYIRVQSMWQTRGVQGHAPPGNFNLIFY